MQRSREAVVPSHLALIMDGNGRWASCRGLPRPDGHRRGARNIEGLLRCAGELGVEVLTLYAFSSDNWNRPEREVAGLMQLFRDYLRSQAPRCRKEGIRLQVIGRRDRLPSTVLSAVEWAQRLTRGRQRLLVRVAIDYSARWSICEAAARAGSANPSSDEFRRALAAAIHSDLVNDPDLIVRTGGEQRLSDFLLWESAYSELVFSECLFPDFGPDQLRQVVAEFSLRNRRFGGLPGEGVDLGCTDSGLANVALEACGPRADPSESPRRIREPIQAEGVQ